MRCVSRVAFLTKWSRQCGNKSARWIIVRANIIWQCMVRTNTLWPVRASNNCVSLARRLKKAGGPAGQCLLWRPVIGGLLSKPIRAESTMGPLCNQASPIPTAIPHTRRICGYVRTSTQPRRLSGRAHDFCDYSQAMTLAVEEHPRHVDVTLRLRWAVLALRLRRLYRRR